MNSIRKLHVLVVALAALLVLSACGKQEAPAPAAPPQTAAKPAPPPPPAPPSAPATPAATTASPTTLVSVDLTNNVDASGKIGGAPATTFAPADKIYALVKTNSSGAHPSTVSAHWEYQGGVTVNDTTQPVTAAGESVTTFHIEKASGWPQGHYKVVVLIDGQTAATKEFDVK
jgi:hypothetical protein